MTRHRWRITCAALAAAGAAALASSATEAADDAPKPPAFTVQVVGQGPPMIFIPGLSCGPNVWDGAVAHFQDRYRCHVLTLAGFAGREAIGEPFLPTVRDQLIAYIRDEPLDRPIIIGHSLGGFLAWWVAAAAPDEVGPIVAVDGVPYLAALLDPDTTAELAEPNAAMMRRMMAAQPPEQFAAANRQMLTMMITDPADVEKVAAQSNRSDPAAVALAMYEMLTIDLRPDMANIRSPALLLPATAAVPDEQRADVQRRYQQQVADVKNCRVVFAPRARHFIQLDEPDWFHERVEEFLADVNGP